ncbi:MAG: YjiH family protein [Selenomonadaceae bacterium]|nr:YjiH family protein [Selenomonadaceae bacterium]MBQ7494096.1 YjiH family protein [Selenomonadaceae bacterium]
MENKQQGSLAGFLVPSIIGIILFMIPVQYDGSWTIVVKIIADMISGAIGEFLPALCVGIVTLSAILGIIFLGKPNFIATYPIVANTFSTTAIWVVIRILGAIFIWLTYLGIQSGEGGAGVISLITSADNGGFVLNDLLSVLVVIFLLAGLLLPLLLDFGLLEFIGALLTKVMRPLFTIPGRAAVDCITSWIGDGTLGVMLTANQYEGGYYSKREAAIISTTFSAVSITFSIVVLAQVDLMEYFGLYYLLICAIGIVCALILPRIPPLSLKKDEYLVEGKAMGESLPEGYTSSFQYGIALAKERVAEHRGFEQFMEGAFKNAAGMWFGVLPVVMCIGTLALILANHTTIFDTLGLPFLPLLQLLDVPQAAEVSKTMIVGFTDMFTPSVLAAGTITSPMAKFIVAVISVTQLIYLSEVGGLILGSKIPVNLPELFILFLERTIISLLIAAPVSHMFFTN